MPMPLGPQRTTGRRARAWCPAAAGLAFLGGLAWLIHTAVEWVVEEAAKEESVIARLAAHQLDQTIRAGKIVLAGAALRATNASDFESGAARAMADLAPRLIIEPQFQALRFVDATGRVVRSSDGRRTVGLGSSLPEYFDGIARGQEFHIGYDLRPDGEAELVVAHRLEDRTGAFLGVAALTFDLARLRASLDATVSLAERSVVAVREDGVALFRLPDDGAAAAGRDLTRQPYFRKLASGARYGTYELVSAFDGKRRAGGYALSPDRELIVLASRTRAEILRVEILGKGRAALIFAGLLALTGAGAVYASSELRRRRRMLDERDELLASLNLADVGIAIADADTQEIVFVNRAFETMTGYTTADMRGKNCRILQGAGTDRAEVAKIRAAIDAGRPVRTDILNYTKDGAPYWNDLSIAPMRGPNGEIRAFVSAFRDVTARVEMTARLENSLARANAADRAKSAFLARMSHELRTPLNAIIGFSETIRLRVMGPLPERYAEYAGDIHDSGRHLLALVERILEMARLEADGRALDARPVDLAEIARAAATLSRAAIDDAAAQLVLELDGPVPALGDPTALRQIAVNLIANAARHGKKGGTIRVRAFAADGRARLEVTDDGPGLDAELLGRLGTPFLNRRSDTADGQGVGLGLAISMELAKRMGGSLAIANAHPGARATLDMPAAAAARSAA
ncbi:MAG: ATP-binding protein [Tagaea sp.]